MLLNLRELNTQYSGETDTGSRFTGFSLPRFVGHTSTLAAMEDATDEPGTRNSLVQGSSMAMADSDQEAVVHSLVESSEELRRYVLQQEFFWT